MGRAPIVSATFAFEAKTSADKDASRLVNWTVELTALYKQRKAVDEVVKLVREGQRNWSQTILGYVPSSATW